MPGLDFIVSTIGEIPSADIYVAVSVLLVASLLRGLTGFGFSAIIVTGLSFILPPAQTVILALFLEIAASLHLLPMAWKNIDWVLLRALALGFAIGTPVGMLFLAYLNPDVMRLIISGTVLTFAILILKGFVYRGPRSFSVHSGLGLLSGICNGIAALGGLPIVTFLLSTNTRVAATRATLIALFFATDIYALFFAGWYGMLNKKIMVYAILAIPILVIGVGVGQRLFHVASPAVFKKIAIVLLLGLSVTGIIRASAIMLGM